MFSVLLWSNLKIGFEVGVLARNASSGKEFKERNGVFQSNVKEKIEELSLKESLKNEHSWYW